MRTRELARRLIQNTSDRGSVSLWVVIFAFVTLALLILIVDGGQVIVAKSRAADIAEQAARAAADDINPAALRNGQVTIAAGACDTPGPASDPPRTSTAGSFSMRREGFGGGDLRPDLQDHRGWRMGLRASAPRA